MNPPRIKILHVVLSLEAGGMENGVVNLTHALDPAEFDVHVCCLDRAGEFATRLTRSDCVHVLDKPPGFSWCAAIVLAAKRTSPQFAKIVIDTANSRT